MPETDNSVAALAKVVSRSLIDLSQAVERIANASTDSVKLRSAIRGLQRTAITVKKSVEPIHPQHDETWTDADKAWGYKFGCEGLRKKTKAAEFIGCSRPHIYALADQNLIRVAANGQVCFRSLKDYCHSLEK